MNCERCYKPDPKDDDGRRPWRVGYPVTLIGAVPATLCNPCRREFHKYICGTELGKAYSEAELEISYLEHLGVAGTPVAKELWMQCQRTLNEAWRALGVLSEEWLVQAVAEEQ